MVPVSKSSILDTILAQLQTMSTLYSLLRSDKLIPSIMEYAQPLVVEKLPFYVTETSQDLEAAIALASYASAEADAKFRLMGLDMQSYSAAVQQVCRLRAAFRSVDKVQHLPKSKCGSISWGLRLIPISGVERSRINFKCLTRRRTLRPSRVIYQLQQHPTFE